MLLDPLTAVVRGMSIRRARSDETEHSPVDVTSSLTGTTTVSDKPSNQLDHQLQEPVIL